MVKKTTRWFFPTNSHNIRLILAQGLLAGRDGFLEKYYRDLLELCPGRIPLFKNEVDEQSLQWVTSEAEHLQACLIEVDSGMLEVQGNIQTFKQGQWVDSPFAEADSDDTTSIVALPAPLPLTVIKKIIFENNEHLQNFQKDCETRGNIVLDKKLLSVTKKDAVLFRQNTKDIFEHTESEQHTATVPAPFAVSDNSSSLSSMASAGQVDYREAYAWGGMLALLFYMAKNGRLSHDFYACLSEGGTVNFAAEYTEVVSLFANLSKPDDESGDNSQQLSEREQINHKIGKIATCSDTVKDDLLVFFKDHPWQDEKVKGRAMQLYQTLQQFDSGSDLQKKPSDYFSKETFLGKSLLMLFYRESSEDWLNAEHTLPGQFDEIQLLGFAVLFGLRDKFTGIAPFLRRYNHLQNHISVLMARHAHNSVCSRLSFSDPAKKPESIWGLLQKKTSRKKLVTQLKLQTSVSTVMSARQFRFESGKIIAQGIIEPDYLIDEASYYQEMQHKVIDDTAYNKLYR